MTVSNKLKISALYAAVFSRAPDKNGLDFWLSQAATSNNVFLDIANGFVQHPVFTQVYGGLNNADFVNALYVNILGGAGDAGGVTYWTGLLTTQTRAQVLSSFVQSSLEVNLTAGSPAAASLSAADLAAAVIRQNTITNKASVGVSFAELLGTASNLAATTNPATLAGLQADAAYKASVEAIKNVTHVKSTADNAVANLQAAQASGNPIAYLTNASSNAGQTFTLTAGVDLLTGTSGNDTFIADNTQTVKVASVADNLVGGLGSDTLIAYGELASAPKLTSIENVILSNFADTKSANFSTASGITSVLVQEAAGAATVSVNDGVAVTIQSNTDATKAQTVNFGSTDTSANLTLDAFKTNTTVDLAVTGTKVATLNLSTSGTASTIGKLNGDAALTKVVITGNKDLTVTDALEDTVATVDASAFTGKLSIKTTNVTAAPNATAVGGSVDLVDVTIIGGSGNDTIDVSANVADNEIAVNAGAGDDTVIIGQVLSNATSSTAGDVLNGGSGTDTLTADVDLVDAAAISTALTGVTGFEILNLVGFGDANVVNVANISADLKRVNLSAVSGAHDNTINFAAGASTLGINIAAAVAAGESLTVDAAGTGTTDSLDIVNMLTTGQMLSSTSDIITTDFETVAINTGSYTTAAAQLINVLNVGAANTLTLTGSNGLTTTATTGIITAKVIDATAMTGALVMNVAAASGVTTISGGSANDTLRGDDSSTINGGAGNDIITGGTGNDILNGDAGNDTITTDTGNDTVNGGAGNDIIIIGANLTFDDTINGGEGTDVLSITAGSVTANSQTANVTNIETLRISDGGAQDVSFFGTATGVTAVELATAGNAITGARAGLQVNLVAATAASSFALATATGTADVVSVNLTSTGALTQVAALTISAVETINVTSTDTDTTAHQNTLILTASAAKTVNVSGNAGTILTATGSAAVTTFNASGVVLAAVTNNGVTYTSLNTTVGEVVSITGSNGVDSLTGTAGANDIINGGAGADTLTYTGGADVFTGGAGNDAFVLTAGAIGSNLTVALTIADLTVGDTINLSALTPTSAAATDGALGAKITLGAAATLAQYLDAAAAAVNGATIAADVEWFQFGGNTFLVVDDSVATAFAATDTLVKITGLVDLSTSTLASEVLTVVAPA